MKLLSQIKSHFYSCRFETSDFALWELSQVIRDNLVASKMMRDAQSLVYFQSLKDQYRLDEEELADALAYSDGMRNLLAELKIEAFPMQFRDESKVDSLCYTHGIDTSDAMHLAWALDHRCQYFVTSDERLISRVKDDRFDVRLIEGMEPVLPATLETISVIRTEPYHPQVQQPP